VEDAVNPTALKFGHPETLLAAWTHWAVLLRPAQVTLGSLVLVCSDPVQRFGAISPGAAAELREVAAAIERALGECLRFDRLNYLMLMMVDPDVHFHVIPRYAQARSYAGSEFGDPFWPGPPDVTRSQPLPESVREALTRDLRARLVSVRSR
jgi:diadenosine tetraphosphate (Ap4A) HIT family hydrolase